MVSDHLFFITERITDFLELEEERKVEYSDAERIMKQRIIKSIQELHEQLSRVVVYLRDVEQRSDEQQHDLDPFYIELSHIAVSSDHILNHIFSFVVAVNDTYDDNTDTASDISHLVDRIRNSHHLLPFGSNYNINIIGNTNLSGRQIINYDPTLSRAPIINRISRPKTYGEYPDSDLVGFEQEIQTLLHHLMEDNETHVVGIVGMGGLGKTTLAKHIYHHPNINTHFTRKVWVCISESWDKTSVLKEICSQVAPEAKDKDYGEAIRLLSKHLRSQSYLLVLDDMWSIDAWWHISPAFPPCSSGSKVVVTSRNKFVPIQFDGTVHIVEPKPLDDEQSLELFKKKALLPENISGMLLQMGEEMVKKCKGLPLAIVALAGVLGKDKRPCNWERVSKTMTHNILKVKNQSTQGVVKEVLELSYYELDHHLKQCVLYLRLFPEDYEVNAKKLMKMWIAEGFLSTKDDQEFRAEEYLDEIVQRYIVKVVKTNFMGQVVRIQIHDLIRQMFVNIDKERGVLRDSLRLASSTILNGDEQNFIFSDMSLSERSIANVERLFLSKTSSHIRSVIFLNHSRLFESVLQSMFVKFRLLRVLILDNIVIIPEEIGNLIHLRYFELEGHVKQFPGFVGNLRNLWTLNIRKLKWEREAEMNLCKLKELRHLYLPFYILRFIDMKKLKLERLEKLKILWNVRGGEWMLLGMTGLSVVLEKLSVLSISSEEQLEVVFRTPSITSYNLQTLELDWYDLDGDVKLRDMNILRECKSLKKLKLRGEIEAGTDLIFPPNLIKLELRQTNVEEREVMNIISESCPHLEILYFSSYAFKGELLVCNTNSFPKLVKLTLFFLRYLRKWIIESTAMPSLHYLTIEECWDLTVTPEGWTRILQIPQLTIKNCSYLKQRRRSDI